LLLHALCSHCPRIESSGRAMFVPPAGPHRLTLLDFRSCRRTQRVDRRIVLGGIGLS
jgi:hypothetical protein